MTYDFRLRPVLFQFVQHLLTGSDIPVPAASLAVAAGDFFEVRLEVMIVDRVESPFLESLVVKGLSKLHYFFFLDRRRLDAK